MQQGNTNQQLRDSRCKNGRIITHLILFTAATLLVSGVSVVTGFMQSKGDPAGQKLQKRRGLEIRNPVQTKANSGETSKPHQSSETKVEKDPSLVPVPFYVALEERGVRLEGVCSKDDAVARRVLEEYGAIFVASESVRPPPVCMFTSEAEVLKYQNDVRFTSATIGGTQIQLQPAAMAALMEARREANKQRLDITPRGGSEAARRSYSDTLRLWNSRFFPGLARWNSRGRLSREQVARLRNLPLHDQVAEVLELEKRGIFFSTDLSKSILYSVAAPGTSQHISMLALDVAQFNNARVRQILAQYGWFQTVKSDLPHFTYLGVDEKELPSRGLRRLTMAGRVFWIPNVTDNGQRN
jgi:hypothetical protein